jgi:phosphatidylglycerophosphate synthase
MHYTLKAIADSLTPEKRKADGTMTRYLYRPVSIPSSWLFLRLGMTPNAVTILSGFLCLVAFCLSLFPAVACHRVAIYLYLVFAVLDCADGNMARVTGKKTTYGGWLDAAGGYLAYTTLLLSMGLSCLYRSGDSLTFPFMNFAVSPVPFQEALWVLVAALAASANTLMRLFHQAFKNASFLAGIQTSAGAEKRFSEEIGVTGYLPLLYLAGYETGYLPLVLLAYAAIYGGGFCVSTLSLLNKVSKSS